jgi:hypothetical protein
MTTKPTHDRLLRVLNGDEPLEGFETVVAETRRLGARRDAAQKEHEALAHEIHGLDFAGRVLAKLVADEIARREPAEPAKLER